MQESDDNKLRLNLEDRKAEMMPDIVHNMANGSIDPAPSPASLAELNKVQDQSANDFRGQSSSSAFEYSLENIATVLQRNGSSIFYLDHGEPYTLRIKLTDNGLLERESKLYVCVQLDFTNEEYRKNRNELIERWFARHRNPLLRFHAIDANEENHSFANGDNCKQINEANIARVVVPSAAEMRFSLQIDCLPCQFEVGRSSQKQESTSSRCEIENFDDHFFLLINVHSDRSGELLDTTVCQVKSFWKGRASHHYRHDRYALIDSNAINSLAVTCAAKYELMRTILNPIQFAFRDNFASDHCTMQNGDPDQQTAIVAASSSCNNRSDSSNDQIANLLPPDFANISLLDPQFVCMLKAPRSLLANATYLDRATSYELLIRPTIFTNDEQLGSIDGDNPDHESFLNRSEQFITFVSLEFDRTQIDPKRLDAALSNWSVLSGRDALFDVSLEHCSELCDSVIDMYHVDYRRFALVWRHKFGANQINFAESRNLLKLALIFHCESSRLARFLDTTIELNCDLVVESGHHDRNGIFVVDERARCPICIFEQGNSARQLKADRAWLGIEKNECSAQQQSQQSQQTQQQSQPELTNATNSRQHDSLDDYTLFQCTSSRQSFAIEAKDSVCDSIDSNTKPMIAESDEMPKDFSIRIEELYVNGEKQEIAEKRLMLSEKTVDEFSRCLMRMIERETRLTVDFVIVFLRSTEIVQSTLDNMQTDSAFSCSIFENENEGDLSIYMAYLEPIQA